MQNTDEQLFSEPPRIELLSEHLIDQIKAGEVIESTANMAKELIENAIDADATKITIKIKNDAMDFFSITDNGHGIYHLDLPLVFARHATSKIQSFDDIYNLDSYGFRGEALASLGAIAKVRIKTKTAALKTFIIEQHFGKTQPITSLESDVRTSGTEIIVTDLFQNTPARLKFLQNKVSENQKFKKMIQAYILAYPEITWDLHLDGEFERFEANDLKNSHHKILSQNLESKTLDYKNIQMTLLIDLKSPKKRNYLSQFIYVNKRPVNFPVAHSILVKTLGITPAYALFIETRNENIDVNVHPAKTEIKFLDKSIVLSLLTSLLKNLNYKNEQSPASNQPSLNPTYSTEFNRALPENILLTKFKNLILLSQNQVVTAGLRLDLLLQFILKETLDSSQNSVFPLLVSKPLFNGAKKINPKFLNFWQNKGLTLETQNDKSLILKTIPENWINLNFEYLVQHIIENNITEASFDFSDIFNFINLEHIPALLSQFPREQLFAHNILQELDALNIHE